MAGHFCSVVPPYILEAIAECDEPHLREMAVSTLAAAQQCHHDRHTASYEGTANTYSSGNYGSQDASQGIVPDYLLRDISSAEGVDEEIRGYAKDTLDASSETRQGRTELVEPESDEVEASAAADPSAGPPTFTHNIYDAEHGDLAGLPGVKLVRKLGGAPVEDLAVNQVHDNTLVVLNFFWDVFEYASVDGRNMTVVSSVHFRNNFGNAAWYVNRARGIKQMYYGDGDGKVLVNFTKPLEIAGHELTHAITHFNSSLVYQDESGALNEHISDVFGVLVKQKFENKKASEADWLIGEECLLPGNKGVALRHMLRPGTAYKGLWKSESNPAGRDDPQPDHYSKIPAVKDKFPALKAGGPGAGDWGGVHYFSGIPNRAFALCAVDFGGNAWEKAGKIWWETCIVREGKPAKILPDCTFIQFADVTVETAQKLYGSEAAKRVRHAWTTVGVVRPH